MPAPFHAPGSSEGAEARASYRLAAPVEPTGVFRAGGVEGLVRGAGTCR